MGKVADYSHGEPPPKDSTGPGMHDLVIQELMLGPIDDATLAVVDLMKDRKVFGLKKYNKPLQAFNGRNPLKDLIDELGDALVYARQLWQEKPAARDNFDLYRAVLHMTKAVMEKSIAEKNIDALTRFEAAKASGMFVTDTSLPKHLGFPVADGFGKTIVPPYQEEVVVSFASTEPLCTEGGGSHCVHWDDGHACCDCPAPKMTDEEMRSQGMIE